MIINKRKDKEQKLHSKKREKMRHTVQEKR